ncbi:hypothetical protein AOQ84DRAFT_383421 [Glonium stellatum]|uniref:Uncharacterized protein n=1 Tax=Glonium stellatum TaxID=574774 RepID=A0A8E2EN14_9PEZI|nr:hypothetical protein AOQ84DRAFT_383421 [Glonium stellatum]
MLTPELDILKPIDPSITDSDLWQQYVLSGVQVYNAKTREPASLLDAYADTPVTVEGRLEPPDRNQQQYLMRRPYSKAVAIEAKNVMRYSYAQAVDTGEIVLWALGESGWLEIRPARSYKATFQDMIQAIELLYFVADVYSEPRKRGGGPSADLVFQEYAEDSRFRCDDRDEAAEIFYKHRLFLIMAMLNRAQGIGWSSTPLYQHMKNKFPKDFQTMRDKINGKDGDKPAQTRAKSKVAKSVGSLSKAERSSRSESYPAKQQKPANAPKKDDSWWEATVIWEIIQKAVAQDFIESGDVTIDGIAELMVKKYEIDDEEQAANYIRVHASNLRYMMQHPKRRRSLHFVQEPIFEELASIQLPAATIRKVSQIQLRPRRVPLKTESSEEESSEPSSSSNETPRGPYHAHKGKSSVLRPKSNKLAGKGRGGKRGKTNTSIATDEDSDEILSNNSDIMELSAPSPSKRKSDDDQFLINPRKRPASRSNSLNSPPSSISSSDTEAPSDPLPLRWKQNPGAKSSTSAGSTFLPSIISTALPSFAANAPGDTFICTFEGCTHKVFGASTASGKAFIKEHFEEHTARRQEQLELVMSEEQRSRLPVSNLIKRIREMADQQQSLFQLPGITSSASGGLPRAIERRE